MYDPNSESSQFRSEVSRIDHWGRSLRPVYFILGILALGFALYSKANKAYEVYPPWVFASVLCLLLCIHGFSLLLQSSAIQSLLSSNELAELPEDSDDLLMWKERLSSAKRGAQFYLPAALAVFFGIMVEVASQIYDLPKLWLGAVPAGCMLFGLAARFHFGEQQALPRILAISGRLIEKEKQKIRPKQ